MDRNTTAFNSNNIGRLGGDRNCRNPARPGPAAGPARQPRKLAWSRLVRSDGQALYQEGQVVDKVFVVISGIVKLVAHLPNGRARILGLHGPGAVLGLLTPANDPPRAGDAPRYGHSAIAVEDLDAIWLSSEQVRTLRNQGAREYVDLLERHCEELRQAERWTAEFSADTTPCRIARLIKYLAELQQLPNANEVELLTCQEMGEVIGVSTESASRVLAKFKRSGVLRRSEARPGKRHYQFNPDNIDAIAFT
jgi:CRP/FNR family transcriptional regulator, anaerobic regulatory protein